MENVLVFARAVAAALIAILVAGPVGLCEGWQVSPEARMACCVEGVACPMHTSDDTGGGAPRAVTQVDADRCCAASEQNDANPTATPFTGASAVVTATQSIVLPPQTDTSAWSRIVAVPNRGHTVSRHLLLSVFLV